MELELGLALPINNSAHFPTKKSDNIGDHNVENDGSLAMEFKNLLMMKKRSLATAFDDHDVNDDIDDQESNRTLSLLVWNGRRPNHDDDDDDEEERRRKPFNIAFEKDGDDDEIVGWPPIRTWRKKLLGGGGGGYGGGHGYRINGGDHHHHQRAAANDNNNYNFGRGINRNSNSIFVKVKMEGVMIGRKIDLMLFDSYQSLTHTLLNMFAKHKRGENDDGLYILSYLDREGDWLLAGDVPWQTFIESVQRMEILVKRSS